MTFRVHNNMMLVAVASTHAVGGGGAGEDVMRLLREVLRRVHGLM